MKGIRSLASSLAAALLAFAFAAVSGAEGSPSRILVVPLDGITAADLRAEGAEILRLLPDAALVSVPSSGAQPKWTAAARPWTGRDALSPALRALDPDREVAPLLLVLAPGTDTSAVAEELRGAGAEIAWADPGRRLPEIGLRSPAGSTTAVLARLENLAGLVTADLQPGARLANDDSAWRCQSSRPGSTPLFERGLLGEGQVVGIMDTGIDADHCAFVDVGGVAPALNGEDTTVVTGDHRKLLAVDFWWAADWPEPGPLDWDDHGHGSHVAGTIAGDAGVLGIHDGFDGMAPAARLVVQDGGFGLDDCADLPGLGCPLRSLEPVLGQAWAQGARIHSNSWGDEENLTPYGRYTERTADADRFVWEHPDMLVLFAAGNEGWRGDDTIASPSTGKNVVSVGATTDAELAPLCPASFSSRGWTQDGRIKPDVVAPGQGVASAATNFVVGAPSCGWFGLSGTSMACPTAAGLAALVRQYFTEGRYPDGVVDLGRATTPSAALLKAMLIASGRDLRELGCQSVRPVPSRDQGWGVVVLDDVLPFPGDPERLLVRDRRQEFDAADDPAVAVRVSVPVPGPLKVVLVWTDPPSTSLAARNLVNDLDLEVEGPSVFYRGNVLADGVSVAGGEPDQLNNVEVVRLGEAPSGAWTITVRPQTVVDGPQGFALVVLGPIRPELPAPREPSGRR